MRCIYLFVFFLLFIFEGYSQKNHFNSSKTVINPYLNSTINSKTVNCIDSVRYPQSKLSGLPEYGPLTNNTATQSGISQAFHLNTTASIHGIGAYFLLDFDGVAGNFSPVTAQIKVYNIDGQNYPTTPIDSAMVQVMDVGFNEQVLMFSNPITVSDSFAIAVEMSTFNAVTDTIWYTTNICGWNGSVCTVGDGNNESLSCVLSPDFISANGSHWFNNNIEVFGWNIDFLMHPIIEQAITSTYTTDKDSICPEDTVTFTNTTTVNTIGMFNQYNTTTNPLYAWNFDDGTGTYNVNDTSYVFNVPGNSYNVQLKTAYYGYSVTCIDSSFHTIFVYDTAMANFGYTHLGGGVYQFNDSSSAANTYSWDFGDGSPLDNSVSPTHTYSSPNNYTVCLTVTDTNGCNVDSICQTITFALGVDEEVQITNVNVFPIPANKHFNVNVPSKYLEGEIVITDVVGKTLHRQAIGKNQEVNVLTEGISSGIYFVSIDHSGERVFTQRIIIDK